MRSTLVAVFGVLALLAAGMTGGVSAVYAKGEHAERLDESKHTSQELADLYQKRAEEQEEVVKEHRVMRKEAERQARQSKGEQAVAHEEMIRHCTGIIQSAKSLRDEYLGLSDWHARWGGDKQWDDW